MLICRCLISLTLWRERSSLANYGIKGISHGFGQHIDQLSCPRSIVLYYSKLLNWNLDLFYAFSLGCSKLALLSLYWRLFGITSIRNPIRWLAGCSVIWIVVRVSTLLMQTLMLLILTDYKTFLTIFMCVPVQGFWDKTIDSTCNINEQKFFFGSTFPHLLIDVVILCLPIWQISKLQLELLQKIGLYITFAFGIVYVTTTKILHYNLFFSANAAVAYVLHLSSSLSRPFTTVSS